MRLMIIVVLFLSTVPAVLAFDITGDVGKSIRNLEKEIQKNPDAISEKVMKAVHDTGKSIERAALVQSATESALASRIQYLEATVRTQSEIIKEFKTLVAVLKNEIEALKKQ